MTGAPVRVALLLAVVGLCAAGATALLSGGGGAQAAGPAAGLDPRKAELLAARRIGPAVASAGSWTLFATPARGGDVDWRLVSPELESRGRFGRGEATIALAARLSSGDRVVFGRVRAPASELRVPGGDARRLPLRNGFFLVEVPSAGRLQGAAVVALGPTGRELARARVLP